jgi:hypothetical protein
MAIKLVKDAFDTPAMPVTLDGSTDLAENSLCDRNSTNGDIDASTASSVIEKLFGVVVGDPAATATEAHVIPIVSSPLQLWEVDTKNNTAAAQLYKACILQNAVSVDNTGTHVAGPTGVFIPTAIVGAASDKKMRGYFVATHQQST